MNNSKICKQDHYNKNKLMGNPTKNCLSAQKCSLYDQKLAFLVHILKRAKLIHNNYTGNVNILKNRIHNKPMLKLHNKWKFYMLYSDFLFDEDGRNVVVFVEAMTQLHNLLSSVLNFVFYLSFKCFFFFF